MYRKSEIQKALEKTPNLAILFVDKNGVIKFINKEFENVFNLTKKEYYSVKFNDLISRVEALKELQSFEFLCKNISYSKDFTVSVAPRCFRLTVSVVLEKGLSFDGFMLTLIDFTREKELEEKKLEHERMLIANAKMAVIGEMINSISHQQRQPLSAVMLSLDNISECLEEGHTNGIIKNINRAKSGIKLMDETLTAFRNFYKNDEKEELVDIKNIINELVLITKPQMDMNAIAFEVSLESGEFCILSIASYIKQILISLLSNAKDELVSIKDSEFEPKIAINLYKNGSEICISISDNGGGISDSEQLFEPFYTTKQDIGTGMGLYVAKILAQDRLNARLELKSKRDPTEFCLSFFLKS